jgi:isoleucyl-tRNA synthetase
VPGWDCHGLPIELKALNTLSDKADVRFFARTDLISMSLLQPISIRRKASQVATQAIEIQKRQFKEWAIMADWENSYRTMDKSYVIKQLEVFREMVGKGMDSTIV